jgi:hypothetical protein
VSQLFQDVQSGAIGPFFYFLCLEVAMATLAAYILLKAQRLELDEASKAMQKNVAAVATVFCLTQMPILIQWAEVAFTEKKMITLNDTTMPREISNIFLALNSVVNIFIYVLVGFKFPRTLFTLLTECRQKERRGGQRVRTRAVPRKEVAETKL